MSADHDKQALFEALVELLADALAPRIADLLDRREPSKPLQPSGRRLLTIDELVERLPAGKRPATWKAWLYQRTRLNQVPGCHRIGGRLFFNPEITLPWLLGETGAHAAAVDLCGQESLHAELMAEKPTPGRTGGQRG